MTNPADRPRVAQGPSLQRWVNEGGSLAPGEGRPAPASHRADRNEARDTVAGCRNRAAEDRLSAAGTDTENGRQVLERSAASWERRADEMEETENASAQQRAADRELWASEERDHPLPPDGDQQTP
jgi:hypothetical protein